MYIKKILNLDTYLIERVRHIVNIIYLQFR